VAGDAHRGTRPSGHKSRFDGVKDFVYEKKSLGINGSVSRFLKYTYEYLKFPRIRILINSLLKENPWVVVAPGEL